MFIFLCDELHMYREIPGIGNFTSYKNQSVKGIFNDKEAGSIVRIKGFIRSNDAWLQINATRHGVRINPSPEGQELFIVIGENLDKEIIGKHWKSYRNGL